MPQQDTIDLDRLSDEQLLQVIEAASRTENHGWAADAVAELFRRLDYSPTPQHNLPKWITRFVTGSLWRQKPVGEGRLSRTSP